MKLAFPITIRLSGVSYGDAQQNIRKWGCRDIGTYALVREPDNPHDPNAISVALFGEFFMGYVPKDFASVLAPMMDSGRRLLAEFVGVNKHPYHDVIGFTVRIVETTPSH
jgi:hypothetical protein